MVEDEWEKKICVGRKVCLNGLYNPYVLVDGTLIPCCHGAMSVLTNPQNREQMTMGNVFESGFMRAWRSEKAVKVRRAVLENRRNFGYCRECFYDEKGLFGIFYKISQLIYK